MVAHSTLTFRTTNQSLFKQTMVAWISSNEQIIDIKKQIVHYENIQHPIKFNFINNYKNYEIL